MNDPVIVEISVAVPPERVWRALREPGEIRRWHGWEYDGIEAEIDAIYIADVEASESDLSLDTGAGRFELEARNGATRLRVTRPAPDGAASWDGVYDEINEGWLTFSQQLRHYLERHDGGERRTIYFDKPAVLPSGERWFESEHQTGVLAGEQSLVVVTRERTIVSSYARAWG